MRDPSNHITFCYVMRMFHINYAFLIGGIIYLYKVIKSTPPFAKHLKLITHIADILLWSEKWIISGGCLYIAYLLTTTP